MVSNDGPVYCVTCRIKHRKLVDAFRDSGLCREHYNISKTVRYVTGKGDDKSVLEVHLHV